MTTTAPGREGPGREGPGREGPGREGPGREGPALPSQRHGKWWPLAAVCIGVFMLLIDITVVNVALPQIRADLHATFSQLQWVVDAYALLLSVLQLTAGALGDRIGRKNLFIWGIVVFTLASAACGLAPGPLALDLFRAVQGVGGAIMFANSLAIIGENYVGADRGTAFGVWGLVAGASIAVGPLVGGAVTSGIDWRWIFWINVPIGVVAGLLAALRLGPSRAVESHRIDWVGLVVSGAGLTALVYALIEAGNAGWASPEILSLLAAAAVLLGAFVVVELRLAHPMLDVRLFGRPGFTGAQVAAFAISASLFSLFLYLTIYLQDVLGYSAFGAGLRLLPITALTLVAAPVAGRLSARVPYRLLLPLGLTLVGVGLLAMSGLSGSSGWTALLAGFVLAGLGSGIVNPPLGSLAVSVVDQARSGMGAGVNNSFRQIGLATGIGALGTIFTARIAGILTQRLPALAGPHAGAAANVISSGALGLVVGRVPPGQRRGAEVVIRSAFVSGLDELFLVTGAVALAGALACALLIRQRDIVSVRPQP